MAPAPTDLADHPTQISFRLEVSDLHGQQRPRRGHPCTGKRAKGTLIRHASLLLAPPVGSLTIPVIETAFETLLVAAVGLAALLAAGFLAATRAAITLSAITMMAEIKNAVAGRKMTNPLSKNSLTGSGHRSPEAELDNRHRSWQDDSHTDLEVLGSGAANKKTPVAPTTGVFCFRLRVIILANPACLENACGDDID
jgi:hypothetical protein